MYHFNDLVGKKYYMLTVIRENGRSKDRHILWLCKCDCGNDVSVPSNMLVSGHTKSCGCLQKKSVSKSKTIHGGCRNHNTERLYNVWKSIKKRCDNPNSKGFQYYGGRGIKMCKEWHESYSAFRDWALQNGYNDNARFGECTIDRINVNGNYEPSNCRWVDMKVQNNNKMRVAG